MSNPISPLTIRVCQGSVCLQHGAPNLESLLNLIPKLHCRHVEICGMSCQGYCKTPDAGQPPFARVNGQTIPNATFEHLADLMNQMLA